MNSIASVCCKEECEGTEYECACQECSKAEHDRSYSEFPNNSQM